MKSSVGRSARPNLGPLSLVVCLAIAGLGVAACALGTGSMATNPEIKPPDASVSPKMDFAKIRKIGIFPLFPVGGIEDETFGEALISSLTGEVQTRQSQWGAMTYREVLEALGKHGLGRGYKNLQADFNSYTGPGGQLVLTSQTRDFLKEFQRVSGVDAFLIGSYDLGKQAVTVRTLLLSQVKNVDICRVRLTLIHAAAGDTWWTATVGRYGDRDGIIREIAQSLAANLGKGVLRQL